jgi:hypothetical protein
MLPGVHEAPRRDRVHDETGSAELVDDLAGAEPPSVSDRVFKSHLVVQ